MSIVQIALSLSNKIKEKWNVKKFYVLKYVIKNKIIFYFTELSYGYPQSNILYIVHSVHYTSISTTSTKKCTQLSLFNNITFKTLNSFMLRTLLVYRQGVR